MTIQYISDDEGKTTGVFIPIAAWNKLKEQLKNHVDEETLIIPDWHKKEVEGRILDYQKNPASGIDFDLALDDIEKEL